MTELLWGDSARVDAEAMAYMAGEDVELDRQLFCFDLRASQAHAYGLQQIGVLQAEEYQALSDALEQLKSAFESGAFVLDRRFEDGHSAIEWYLTETLGDLGAKIHTGRSRNDQVQAAVRLYLQDRLSKLAELNREIASAFLAQAQRGREQLMPGYTHLQAAVPSTVGLWMAAFAEAFIDNLELTQQTCAWLDCCPLGTAAGYGVNLPLERDAVSEQLGFSRLQLNPMYVQNSRGKFEIQALQCIHQSLLDTRRFAWDISLFTNPSFAFVEIPAEFRTGSSIMPNKSNPDLVELMRAAAAVVQGGLMELFSTQSLPSGYHRDLQLTKAPLIRAMEHGLATLRLLPRLVSGLAFHRENMQDAVEPEMLATDLALKKAADGMPFRQAYREVKAQLQHIGASELAGSIKNRISAGACGNLQLSRLRQRLERL